MSGSSKALAGLSSGCPAEGCAGRLLPVLDQKFAEAFETVSRDGDGRQATDARHDETVVYGVASVVWRSGQPGKRTSALVRGAGAANGRSRPAISDRRVL